MKPQSRKELQQEALKGANAGRKSQRGRQEGAASFKLVFLPKGSEVLVMLVVFSETPESGSLASALS